MTKHELMEVDQSLRFDLEHRRYIPLRSGPDEQQVMIPANGWIVGIRTEYPSLMACTTDPFAKDYHPFSVRPIHLVVEYEGAAEPDVPATILQSVYKSGRPKGYRDKWDIIDSYLDPLPQYHRVIVYGPKDRHWIMRQKTRNLERYGPLDPKAVQQLEDLRAWRNRAVFACERDLHEFHQIVDEALTIRASIPDQIQTLYTRALALLVYRRGPQAPKERRASPNQPLPFAL